MQRGLVDEYHLLVYPLVRGGGKRLFAEGTRVSLRLVDSTTFKTGVVALTYQPAATAQPLVADAILAGMKI